MANRRHILLVGSRAFAQCATAVLESCEDVETLHTTHVTIELFLSQWRPDCAIINCDDVKQEPLAEIQELSRFRPKITIVLVNSRHVSQLAASAVSAIPRRFAVDKTRSSRNAYLHTQCSGYCA